MNPIDQFLKNIIRNTLQNEVCRYQSLDNAFDRNRVVKELMKVLASNYLLHVKSKRSSKSIKTKTAKKNI
ncbi:MAG: hypothetical protein V1920_06940 [Bacillota bacterium]